VKAVFSIRNKIKKLNLHPFTSFIPFTSSPRENNRDMSNKIREVFDRIAGQTVEDQTIPDDIPLLELADQVVRGKIKLSSQQMRMLIEMLPFVAPKLSAVGFVRDADTFASRLERCLQRSEKVKREPMRLIEDLRGRDPRE
jgi:hypothetical protein